ncbi:MAG: AAA-like domain-containing protein [Candidatus Aminicenantes bacterium]|nr:AAA-like domain-containing protein [Candidatus Aminicenantes bacterium]
MSVNKKTTRFFNTAGPVKEEKHYQIDPLGRIDLEAILSLISQEKYFVLHAPRQTGKTSYMLALMDYLNTKGWYKSLYVNVEPAQMARERIKDGILTILRIIANESYLCLKDSFLKDNWKAILEDSGELYALQDALMQWCRRSDKPIVLFLDEIDSLVGDTLISVLRQLRSGYNNRPAMFPQSIVLCGVRDVRDYRIHSKKDKDIITGGSAFNIKAESLRLGNFDLNEIKTLYNRHTKDTGQTFADNVFPLVWELTEGQPWLVNALGYEVCFKMKEGRERAKAISADMINRAKEHLILRRETHLDQLADKLREGRVIRVLEPILSGFGDVEKIPTDDIDYAVDLGLIKKEPQIRISNKIYKEVIPRELTYSAQLTILQEAPWYSEDDGRLNMDKLLTAFQEFYRKHFESWVDGLDYAEAGSQLLLQAFLQRIVNSGGQVEREYGLGRQRTDLLLIRPYSKGVQQVVIEMKIRYGSLESTIAKGLEQTWGYMDKCGAGEGYLLIFDRSEKVSWEKKIFQKTRTYEGTTIKIFGM